MHIKGATSKKRVRDEDRERVASDEQVEQIAGAMPGRLAIMIYLAAWAGLRYGEIAALRRRHIDLKSGGSWSGARLNALRPGRL